MSLPRLAGPVLSILFCAIWGVWPVHVSAQPSDQEVTVSELPINSGDDDFAPFYLMNERALLFTSDRDGEQRVWMSRRTGSTRWEYPDDPVSGLDLAKHVGSVTMTPDGNYMIFAAYKFESGSNTLKGEGRTDLYSAELRGGSWTNVQNLGAVVNSPAWDSHPSLSSDGKQLYFASDREGGRGGTDIYVARRTATGWTAPVNAGPVINTNGNEMSPVIAPDGERLFFSSDGMGGEGGFDLFVTDGGNPFEQTWSGVENLGTPINSIADEHFFVSEPNSKNGYFSSNRAGVFDNYLAFPNPYPPSAQVIVTGRVIDDETGDPIEATVTVTDLESGEQIAEFRSNDVSGEYAVMLTKGRSYAVTAEAPGYLFYSDDYDVPNRLDQGEEIDKDIPLRKGSTRLLIYFDYDKAELKRESFPDLNRALDFLKENRGLNVEIAGHTDSIGSDAYNRSLSQRRAESVRDFLIREGVNRDRLVAKGYGEERPVADNGTDEGRARNRRVEMNVKR